MGSLTPAPGGLMRHCSATKPPHQHWSPVLVIAARQRSNALLAGARHVTTKLRLRTDIQVRQGGNTPRQPFHHSIHSCLLSYLCSYICADALAKKSYPTWTCFTRTRKHTDRQIAGRARKERAKPAVPPLLPLHTPALPASVCFAREAIISCQHCDRYLYLSCLSVGLSPLTCFDDSDAQASLHQDERDQQRHPRFAHCRSLGQCVHAEASQCHLVHG